MDFRAVNSGNFTFVLAFNKIDIRRSWNLQEVWRLDPVLRLAVVPYVEM